MTTKRSLALSRAVPRTASLRSAVLVAAILFVAPSCGVMKWAFTGTDTQPAPAVTLGQAVEKVIPFPFNELFGLALALAGTLVTSKNSSSTTNGKNA